MTHEVNFLKACILCTTKLARRISMICNSVAFLIIKTWNAYII